MRSVPAIAACLALLGSAGTLAADAPVGLSEPAVEDEAAYDDVEEIIVTAEKPARGDIPSPTYIVQTYSVMDRGARLYREGKYREALPYLLIAAKRGFKWSQARAGDIYLHGRDGVPRDIEAGIGWLGVAAKAETAPAIRNYFRDVMTELPREHLLYFATIVADYRGKWDSDGYRVNCQRTSGVDTRGATTSMRLRRLKCTFMDEIPLCRTPYNDPTGGMEWICDRPRS